MKHYHHYPIIPIMVDSLKFRHEQVKYELLLPYHANSIWLAKAQLALLFDTSSQRIDISLREVIRKHHLVEEDMSADFPIRRGKQRYQTKFFRFDLVVRLGRELKASVLDDFIDWGLFHICSSN